ncbi:hypothetical protein A8C56_11205 [Niabella ginsenosidivorans]|uniref:Beta-lactamase-inhibitor-like PepSY-like domain-containing protein n=1 Tax=Niabella ginsenosidivorans TaxID=1176587 RepID=A0A1A9I456_9BACT|nr:hypothetical protein [Niabella ginsenosidivorans]ANH81472.1 hypothetical protein A8C56_11205 [Niabella ginsenosidivorans]
MKKLILIVAAFITVSVNAANDEPAVSAKALETFHQVFSEAADVSWRITGKQNEASFNLNTIRMRVVIDNNGKLVSMLRYYKEEDLPVNIRYSVKKAFENKEIMGVTEFSKNNDVSYYIVLLDHKKMFNVVVDSDGGIIQKRIYDRGDL